MASFEYLLEEFVIAACQGAALPPVVHHDEEPEAKTERVIVTATTGQENPAGSGVYDTALQAELRSTNRDGAATDALFQALESALASPAGLAFGRENFPGGLWLDQEDSTNARDNGRDTMKRSRTYKFFVCHG